MKKIIFLLIASIIACTSIYADTNVEAACESCCCSETESMCQKTENKYYGKFFFGTNHTDKHRFNYGSLTSNRGSIYSGSFGYHVNPSLTIEAEYALRNNDIKIKYRYYPYYSSVKYYGKSRVSSYMVNLIGNLPIPILNDYNIKSFIGGGIGADYTKRNGAKFAWQILTGVKYSINNKIDISLEYRFHTRVFNSAYHTYNHSAGLGIAYKFN